MYLFFPTMCAYPFSGYFVFVVQKFIPNFFPLGMIIPVATIIDFVCRFR